MTDYIDIKYNINWLYFYSIIMIDKGDKLRFPTTVLTGMFLLKQLVMTVYIDSIADIQ